MVQLAACVGSVAVPPLILWDTSDQRCRLQCCQNGPGSIFLPLGPGTSMHANAGDALVGQSGCPKGLGPCTGLCVLHVAHAAAIRAGRLCHRQRRQHQRQVCLCVCVLGKQNSSPGGLTCSWLDRAACRGSGLVADLKDMLKDTVPGQASLAWAESSQQRPRPGLDWVKAQIAQRGMHTNPAMA